MHYHFLIPRWHSNRANEDGVLCDIDIERQSPSLQSYPYPGPSILHEISHRILSQFNEKSGKINLGIHEVSPRSVHLAHDEIIKRGM